ncbi:hypothetical protein [Lutimonas zeaxanthinifaciens]|uniref:hypothetical protein n=1 Tax=Lutimonas zeaxanthinifaciens TaxID=3060215 RepID=UPI00265CF769|nr:hypothetical protein [Lutimonas sp. YSD2104]WKK65277.1 hypothetical protein QZH61_11870 [Lutimonas sp. YSD2104]
MNLIEFNKILANPQGIRKDQIAGLQQIINEYPYFQVAHYLHLNGLKKRRSFKYNDFLKKTAAYTADRSLLFDNITKDDLDIHAAPADLEESLGSADTEYEPSDKSTPERTKADQKEPQKDQSEKSKSEESITEKEKSPEETLGVGKPLQFNKDESYSFREWLQLSNFEPIDRSDEKQTLKNSPDSIREKNLKTTDQRQLIDKFIASNPKINPSLSDSYSDISLDSAQENENLMTETLAHVYVEQKKYEKAITAFTILSLKYPEKSSFFASQIEAVKKLQEK